MLAIATLASCSKEDGKDNPNPDSGNLGAAYMSLSIQIPTGNGTRSSTEEPGTVGEKTINELWLVTFNDNKEIIQHTDVASLGRQVLSADFAEKTPATGSDIAYATTALEVNPDVAYLLVIANPGTQLKSVLQTAKGTSIVTNWATFNEVLKVPFRESDESVQTSILVNELRKPGATFTNFAMINSGDNAAGALNIDEGLAAVDKTKVFLIDLSTTKEQAIQKAKDNPAASVRIERLASKIEVLVKATSGNTNGNGTFYLYDDATYGHPGEGYWTLDVLNRVYRPYATKTLSAYANHTSGFYANAFYTQDPNYLIDQIPALTAPKSGLAYNNLLPVTFAPNVSWLKTAATAGTAGAGNVDYSLENTMTALNQRYQSATRIVVRGYYWPKNTGDEFTKGTIVEGADWFRYGNVNFGSLADVQAQYDIWVTAKAGNTQNYQDNKTTADAFIAACDLFYTRVKEQLATNPTATALPGSVAGFSDLDATAGHLDEVENGGELVKHADGCIRWYKGGLNYWWYEIRHDKSAQGTMEQNKYGVVRNNWYQLTMTTVNGAGTPWYPAVVPPEEYPDPNNPKDPYDPTDPDNPVPPTPDPEDPDNPEPKPEEPIDNEYGYMSFEIEVAPWVHWVHEMPLQ